MTSGIKWGKHPSESIKLRVVQESFEDYRAAPGINFSAMKHGVKSMAKVGHALEGGGSKDTDATQEGRALHAAFLEPLRVGEAVQVCQIRRDKRTKAYQEFLAEYPTQTILTESQWDRVGGMVEALRSHPDFVLSSMDNGSNFGVERSVYWTDPEFGMGCKCRMDMWENVDVEAPVVVKDIKKTVSIEPYKIDRAIWSDYRYDMQLLHYARPWVLLGREVEFSFYMVESEAPHEVVKVELSYVDLIQSLAEWKGIMARIKECRGRCGRPGMWPGMHPGGSYTSSRPTWQKKKEEAG